MVDYVVQLKENLNEVMK